MIHCIDWLEPDLLEGEQNFSESKGFSLHPMAPAREVSPEVPAGARIESLEKKRKFEVDM